MLRIRENGIISEIEISDNAMKILQELYSEKRSYDSTRKSAKVRQLLHVSPCCICGGIPAFKVTYKLEDVSIYEAYCTNCAKRVYSREAVL